MQRYVRRLGVAGRRDNTSGSTMKLGGIERGEIGIEGLAW